MEFLPENLSSEKFKTILQQHKLVLVDFYATWCEPCKILDQILEDLEPEIHAVATIIKLDLDQQADLKTAFSIMSVPTLMLFKNGELQWRMPGFMLQHELKEKIFSFC